jgi:hypothetical protein
MDSDSVFPLDIDYGTLLPVLHGFYELTDIGMVGTATVLVSVSAKARPGCSSKSIIYHQLRQYFRVVAVQT